MSRRPLVLLAAWTLFVWGLRSRNLTDDTVDVGLGEIVPVVGFMIIGLGLVALIWRARGRALSGTELGIVAAVGAVISGYWLIRGVEIFFDDHSGVFIAVHTVLALISIGLSAWTILSIGIGRSMAAE